MKVVGVSMGPEWEEERIDRNWYCEHILHSKYNVELLDRHESDHFCGRNMEFEIGDVVVLKSGGPAMTVTGFTESNILCLWYEDAEHGYVRESFHPGCLDYAEEDSADT